MKKRMIRFISGILLAAMLTGSVPADVLYAQEPDAAAAADAGGRSDASDDSAAEDDTAEDDTGEEISVGNVNFTYIESPYLETPGTQRIVFFFDREITGADQITLQVSDSEGNLESWELTEQSETLYLFEKEFTDSEDTDTYKAVSLKIRGNNNKEKVLNLDDLDIDARFGVNKEYSGISELEAIDEESAASIESSVVTIDENGMTEAQDDIAGALRSMEAERTARSRSVPDAADGARASGDIVVALDPGHDYNDAGAQGFGLREEELTLKIANYCKEELETYPGVSIFMTRTTNTCPYNCTSSGDCIQKRVNAAKAAGADIYVSFHLNSADASSANGAEIIIPNNNWKPALGAEGQELAEEILYELVKLGLTERSIYSKNSQSGDKYSDGSSADYFAVPRMCKKAGFTGIIIEHAFISNSSDVNKFLKTESGLKKLGVADANGIVKYYGLTKSGWKTPVLKTPSAADQGTSISWNSVSGAAGYAVYRKTGTDAWKMIGTTTSASYVDSAVLTNGRTYYYTVRAYRGSEKDALANKYDSAYWSDFDKTGVAAVFMTKPAVSSTAATDQGIKVRWKAVSGVSGYAVYRKTSGSGWGMIATTTSTSYTDKDGMKNGTEYSYTLRAYTGSLSTAQSNKYNAKYWSGYDNTGVKGKYISVPALTGVTAAAGGTNIKWNAVSGASGYAVYRKASGGSWATIGTTESSNYTDTDRLTDGGSYYYTVRAYTGDAAAAADNKYDSRYWSYFDTTGIKALHINVPVLLSTSTAQSGIKVSWTAVGEASGYAVYRKTAGGSWGMIATTTSASYTDLDGMKNNAVYYYTVRAYKGNADTAKKNKYSPQYWSGYDDAGVQGKYISSPVLKSEKVSASGRTISWNPVSGATGYAVYRKVSGGSWSTIDTTTSTSYTDTAKLTNGKTYYYTVRAYTGKAEETQTNRYDSNYWSYYNTSGIKTVYISTPVLGTAVKQESGTKVTWNTVSGATGYAVYRKTPGGSWGTVATTTSNSYTDKSDTVSGCSYTVRAYRGTLSAANANKYSSVYWSGYDSTGVKVSELSVPVLKSVKVDNDGLEVSWNSVSGASGYAVYRKTASTSWGMIGTTASTKYVDTGAGSSGTVYYYTVRAYRGAKDTALAHKYDSLYWSYFDTKGVSGTAYAIEGKSSVTVNQMVKFYNTYSPVSYPAEDLKKGGAATVTELARIFYNEAADEEIKPEVVWCQAMLETGYLKFGGDVDISQYNFGGIGAVGNGVVGESFKNVTEGVRAQVQHLKAYASKTITVDQLKHDLADPRFQYVKKGSAKYVQILGAKENPLGTGWASAAGYGTNIVNLIQKLKSL